MIKILMIVSSLLLAQMATAQTCRDTISASTPNNRFVVNGDEVEDTETGLIWQRCSLGQAGNDCTGYANDSYTWQGALQAGGSAPPWRVPNINELRSIVEEKCYGPAINLTVFPNTVSSHYWSASPSASNSDYAWSVHLGGGCSYDSNKSGLKHVRLVRGGQ